MNTILSIDLDILFSPYIGIYNNFILDYEIQNIWDKIKDQCDISLFTYNQDYFNVIKQILSIYQKQVDKIYIGFDHSSILTAIEDKKNNFTLPYEFTIYNIDYHHDIFYGDRQSEEIKKNIINCGDWVGFLTYNKLLIYYYWYYGIGSSLSEKELIKINNEAYPSMVKQFFNNNFDLDLKIDLLFISISPQWIPPDQYQIIKDLLLTLPKEKIKFLEDPYLYKNFLSIQKSKLYNISYFDFLKNTI